LSDPARFRKVVQRLQDHLEGNLSFHVAIVNANGRVVFSSIDPSAKPIDLKDREHIRVHLGRQTDSLFISEPVLGRVSKEWSIQFTRPIYTEAGQFNGVIVLSVAPGYFSRFYKQIRLGPDAVITLVREGGIIIARSSHHEQGKGVGQTLAGEQFHNTATQGTGFYRRASRVDGIERLYAWRTLPRYGLVVMVGQSIVPIVERYRSEQQAYVLGESAYRYCLQ